MKWKNYCLISALEYSIKKYFPFPDLRLTPRSPGSSPRPENGETYKYGSKDPPENLIKRIFSFPAGQVRVSFAKILKLEM